MTFSIHHTQFTVYKDVSTLLHCNIHNQMPYNSQWLTNKLQSFLPRQSHNIRWFRNLWEAEMNPYTNHNIIIDTK